MKILIHDYAGHPFQVQLSRTLAHRGHQVIHAYATELQTPRGDLTRRADDAATFSVEAVEMDSRYAANKYSFLKRRSYEGAYGRKVGELIRREKPDAVLSSNTPTEIQHQVVQATKAVGGRFYYWVQDFYSLAVDLLLKKKLPVIGSLVGHYYKRLDRQHFKDSDGVICITDDFKPVLDGWGVSPEKVVTVPNWAPIESLPVRPKDNEWSRAQGLHDKYVYLYTGTMGMKHNPALLSSLAEKYRNDDRVRVVVISEGLGADWLKAEKERLNLNNLVLLGYQPFHALPDVMASGDVVIGVLEADAGVFSVPSKILSYLCSQRPILLAAPAVNLATRTVVDQHAGLTCAPNDLPGFLSAAGSLYEQVEQAAIMGEKGRTYAERTFQIEGIATQFERYLSAPIRVSRSAAPTESALAGAVATVQI
jgi:colanic acid biosynthesis glycosyl transferase WcaI